MIARFRAISENAESPDSPDFNVELFIGFVEETILGDGVTGLVYLENESVEEMVTHVNHQLIDMFRQLAASMVEHDRPLTDRTSPIAIPVLLADNADAIVCVHTQYDAVISLPILMTVIKCMVRSQRQSLPWVVKINVLPWMSCFILKLYVVIVLRWRDDEKNLDHIEWSIKLTPEGTTLRQLAFGISDLFMIWSHQEGISLPFFQR